MKMLNPQLRLFAVRELVSRGARCLLIVLLRYGSNNNRWGKGKVGVDSFHSDHKYLRQRLLLAIYQFS